MRFSHSITGDGYVRRIFGSDTLPVIPRSNGEHLPCRRSGCAPIFCRASKTFGMRPSNSESDAVLVQRGDEMPQTENERRISLFPSVIVGLGGTGRRVCGYLKKTLQDRFGNVSPHVRLVAIDTKRTEEANDDL